MGLNDTPNSERTRIAFFGVRNAGKSSLVNAVTGQEVALVSETLGTTTDPVSKNMELLPLGPVTIIDTPGIDDVGSLGKARIAKTRQILSTCDIAVLVVDVSRTLLPQDIDVSRALASLDVDASCTLTPQDIDAPGALASLGVDVSRTLTPHDFDALRALTPQDKELLKIFEQQKTPFIIAWNKADLLDEEKLAKSGMDAATRGNAAVANAEVGHKTTAAGDVAKNDAPSADAAAGGNTPAADAATGGNAFKSVVVSAKSGKGIFELKETMANMCSTSPSKRLLEGLVNTGDVIVAVIPIDSSAPKSRLILPQQMLIRDALDFHASVICCQPQELEQTLAALAKPPKLVVTDSQVFKQVASIVPKNYPLTSFSILMARYKGELDVLKAGAHFLSKLNSTDKVLICEACTHHRQCEDIGTVKMPAWIKEFCNSAPQFEFCSGKDFLQNLESYSLIVHCGACMITQREMHARMAIAQSCGVPMVNYGMAIAQMNGILSRALEPFDYKGECCNE